MTVRHRPPPAPSPPLERLTPDALAAELRRYVPSPWHEWLERYRAGQLGQDGVDAGRIDPGDGGARSWAQDHPPRG